MFLYSLFLGPILREEANKQELDGSDVPIAVLRMSRVCSIILETERVGRQATEAEVRNMPFCGCRSVPHGGMNTQRASSAMQVASWGVETARRKYELELLDKS